MIQCVDDGIVPLEPTASGWPGTERKVRERSQRYTNFADCIEFVVAQYGVPRER
jgi:hypothetical protein